MQVVYGVCTQLLSVVLLGSLTALNAMIMYFLIQLKLFMQSE